MGTSINQIYNNSIWAMNKTMGGLLEAQKQSTTGLAVSKPSDDAIKAGQIIDLNSNIQSISRYNDNIDNTISLLEMGNSILEEMSAIMTDIKTLTLSSAESSVRQQTASTLNEYINQMVSLANTQYADQYLFGGAEYSQAPFTIEQNNNGQITSVTYKGSSDELLVEVADGISVSGVMCGDDLFYSRIADQPAIISREISDDSQSATGAAAGTAASRVSSIRTLTVTDLGAGDWGFSIDGGTTVVSASSASDPANVPVIDPQSGDIFYVDATAVTSAGEETVMPNQANLFSVLAMTRDALGSSSLSNDEYEYMIGYAMDSMNQFHGKLTAAYPSIGGKINSLASLQYINEDIQFFNKERLSVLQDADVTEVTIRLAEYESLYELTLMATSKLFNLSLVKFLS